MNKTFDIIKEIIAEHMDIDENKIKLESSLSDDLGIDSFDTVELIMAFEEQFSIEITDEDAQEIKTIKNAIEFIDKKITEKEEI